MINTKRTAKIITVIGIVILLAALALTLWRQDSLDKKCKARSCPEGSLPVLVTGMHMPKCLCGPADEAK